MNAECARTGKCISASECADIIACTQHSEDLLVCRECEYRQSVQFRRQAAAPAPEKSAAQTAGARAAEGASHIADGMLGVFSDDELWAELHRRHPFMWKQI